jgi:ribosomal protein S18 acetylase RimI-like enzyme
VTIRPIEAGDREAWGALFRDYGVFYETSFDDAVLDGVWLWLMDAAHPVSAFVATDDSTQSGTLVGFAHFRSAPDTFTAASGWVLDDLYVSPDQRGTGLATALIEAVAAACTAAGGGTLRWITAESNTTAQRVYDRLATRSSWVTYERET